MNFEPVLSFIFSFFGALFKILGNVLGLFIRSMGTAFNQMLGIFRRGGKL